MTNRKLDIKTLLDIPEWEKMQDEFANLTGTAIITIDYKGTPVSKHSARTDFCTVIRENPVTRKRCFRCDALAGLEAVRLNRPYIYLCHCGIVDVAVPVMLGDRYLGAVMFGQVRIPNNDTEAKVERLVNEISTFHAESSAVRQDLLEKYNQLPEMEYRKIIEIANMLDSLIKYITSRALKEQTRRLEYEYTLRSSLPPTLKVSGEQAEAHLRELERLTEPPKDTSLAYDERRCVCMSSAVYPALVYIREHPNQIPSMKDMADLCHISPSYFSRLFLKDCGENYTDYVNREKITLAKLRLRESSETVTEIALALGFTDCSYFTKVFKRMEGITPGAYRQERYT